MKTKHTICFVMFLLGLSFQALAYVDPDDILKNLPPPQVNFPVPVIQASMPVLLPQNATMIPNLGKDLAKINFEDQLRRLADASLLNPWKKLASNLATSKKASATPALTSLPEKQPRVTAPTAKATKPPIVDLPPKTGNISKPSESESKIVATETTRIEVAAVSNDKPETEIEKPLIDQQPQPLSVEDKATKGDKDRNDDENPAQPSDASEESEEKTDTEEQVEEEEDAEKTGITGAHDGVIAKATGLYKKSQWKEIKALFSDNPDAADTPDGRKFMLEAELNESKPNYMQIRRYSDQLIKADKNNALGNYGMAVFFVNNRKPDSAKALKHLETALKSKNPPQGASSLYWQLTLKKFAIIFIALLGLIIVGVVKLVKKKKNATIELDNPETDQVSSDSQPENPAKPGLSARFKAFIDKVKNLAQRFKRKKTQEKDESEETGNPINPENKPSESDAPEKAQKQAEIVEKAKKESLLTNNSIHQPNSEKEELEQSETEEEIEETEELEEEELIEEIVEIEVDDDSDEEGVEYEIIEVEEEEEEEES